MRKAILSFFLLILFAHVKAQVKPVYFYGDKVIFNKEKATSYAIYGKLSNQDLWMFKRYDLNDNLLQTGSYNDELLTTPHGKFVFFSGIVDYNNVHLTSYKINGKTRFISQEGEFVNGKEEGKWFTYFPDGNVASFFEFKAGIMQGEYKEFDKYGNIVVSGNYLNNLKHGEWISENGTRIDTFENGILISTRFIKKKKNIKGEVKNKV